MPTLNIVLLGTSQITLDGQPLVLRPRNSARAKAILYYLAATGRAETRERLAGLLWSDWPEKKAREYLRGELHLLAPLRTLYWHEVDGRISLDAAACSSDLAEFRALTERTDVTARDLDRSLGLWSGSFLQGFEDAIGAGAALYLEWLQEQRSSWEMVVRATRYRLAEVAVQTQQDLQLGLAACVQMLASEPEREEVHRLKMRLLALAGQRTAALKQYDECATALLDELGVPPSAETNALYDQILGGEVGPRGSPAQPPPVQPVPFQAPTPAGHFVGREQERDQLVAWLTQNRRSAISAIVGMGGAGKTALATEVAHHLRSRFPDGVLWARVSDDDPLDILQSWALAFDKDLSKIGSAEARAAAMRNILVGKQALIVLDDVVAGSNIDLLLPGTGCPVLITTRDWTEVAARTTQIVQLAELSLNEGLELLSHYLGAGGVQDEQEAATELYATLGGLPLAVEIAAQRLFASPRRNLKRMVRSLQAASDRLASGISNRSVRTSFEVSWDALDQELQQIFAYTGVFDGRGFSAAALAAAAGSGRIEEEVTDRLEHLVTLSMLRLAGNERYVHHRLLADFAGEKLAEQADGDAARLRAAAYYRQIVGEAGGNYDLLEGEWDNLLAGVAAAHQQHAWPLVTESVDGLTAPWFARARFSHAQQGFGWGLDAATAMQDNERSASYAYYLAKIYLRQDEYASARHLLDRAIGVFQEQKNYARLADAYVDLADIMVEQREYTEAEANLAAAETMYEQLHQPIGLATVKSRQAYLAYNDRRNIDAYHLCYAGLACLPPNDGAIARSRTLRLLADLALDEQRYEEAAEFCQQAQVANEAANDQTEAAAILYAQSKLDYFLGNHATALASAQQSAALYAAMGDRKATGIICFSIAVMYLDLNNPEAARVAASQGLEIAQVLRDEGMENECQQLLAEITQILAT